MRRVIALGTLFLVNGFCQKCLTYGTRLGLEGNLSIRDVSGYTRFILLTLPNPICTVRDPNTPSEFNTEHSGVSEVQVNAASSAQSDRLNRLIDHRVTLQGEILPATTGY